MKKKKNGGFLLKLLFIGLAVYYIFTFTSLQIQNSETREQERELQQQLEQQLEINEELQNKLDADIDEQYIESIAKEELGLAKPNEKVFINPTK